MRSNGASRVRTKHVDMTPAQSLRKVFPWIPLMLPPPYAPGPVPSPVEDDDDDDDDEVTLASRSAAWARDTLINIIADDDDGADEDEDDV